MSCIKPVGQEHVLVLFHPKVKRNKKLYFQTLDAFNKEKYFTYAKCKFDIFSSDFRGKFDLDMLWTH